MRSLPLRSGYNSWCSKLTKSCIFYSICLLCFCSIDQLAGNSSQTGNNGITVLSKSGTVSGTALSSADIFIFSHDYKSYPAISGYCDSATSNNADPFIFSDLDTGYYNILIKSRKENTAAFIRDIPVFPGATSNHRDTFKPCGFINASSSGNSMLKFAFIQGSPYFAVATEDGDLRLGPLPPGNYKIDVNAMVLITNNHPLPDPLLIDDTTFITVYPDSTTDLIWQ
ncbi:MAG: hypothetical protein GX556_09335 [Fibrobacter sp.]|nr:hypothetical protein [Fibrobacter sp.]